jgi:hypothetical protein
MSDIADIQRTVEAAKQSFDRVDELHSQCCKDLSSVIDAVADSLRQKQAEMEQHQVQYERKTQECEQLIGVLRSLALTVEDVSRIRSRTIMCDLDKKVSSLGHASWATEGPTEHVAAVVEDNVEYDPGSLRSGLQRVLKKSPARIPKVAEVAEHPSRFRRSPRHRS